MRKAICWILICSHLSLVLSGCATASNKITGTYVSPMQYASYDCEQIQAEMMRISNRLREVCGIQDKKATSDAWCTGIGLIIFWPAFFFMMGGDKKAEIERLKGEYDALEQAAIQKKCPFIQDVEKARTEAQQKGKK
jgi:hypothetical protein